ncbi:CorA family divalent cation transporter, partial [Pseudomonas syringae pv. tagetis]|uniref:CorA family divalent cation transporter n=1 Tax=Pseudomonas syringae group genomosp. 7 TaxID=251699 RepID=UPI0037706882
DMIIENDQSYKQAEIYSTEFAALIDARGNLVNNSTNTLQRKLTLINVVYQPLNLVAGIGGMSQLSKMTAPLHRWEPKP